MKKTFTCRQIAAGRVKGEVLTCTDQILFYHTDPKTGVVTEVGHALEGVSVKDKILVFPGGKGSSVVQMDGLYKLELNGAAPLGFIVREPTPCSSPRPSSWRSRWSTAWRTNFTMQ